MGFGRVCKEEQDIKRADGAREKPNGALGLGDGGYRVLHSSYCTVRYTVELHYYGTCVCG